MYFQRQTGRVEYKDPILEHLWLSDIKLSEVKDYFYVSGY